MEDSEGTVDSRPLTESDGYDIFRASRAPTKTLENEWLHAAANGNDERVAELLVQSPTLCAVISNYNLSALDCASAYGHVKVVARLLAANAPSGPSRTALHCAVAGGHSNVVALLLAEKPGLITVPTHMGETALHLAASNGNEAIFQQLLNAHPEAIDVIDSSGCTVLCEAVRRGHDNLVAQILDLRPEMITAVDRQGWNVLHLALTMGPQSVIDRLLASKPELVFATTDSNITTLHLAVNNCKDAEFIAKLWRMNPQALQHQSATYHTPFHLAIGRRDDLVELFQWSLSLDEIASAFTQKKLSYEKRYRPVMEKQCESLWESLSQDVAAVVFEYLGFQRDSRKITTPKGTKSPPLRLPQNFP